MVYYLLLKVNNNIAVYIQGTVESLF